MQRAAERYGLVVTAEVHDRILDAIRTGASSMVRRQSHRVSIHDVTLDGRRLRVVYDRQRKELVTFLPLEGEP